MCLHVYLRVHACVLSVCMCCVLNLCMGVHMCILLCIYIHTCAMCLPSTLALQNIPQMSMWRFAFAVRYVCIYHIERQGTHQ